MAINDESIRHADRIALVRPREPDQALEKQILALENQANVAQHTSPKIIGLGRRSPPASITGLGLLQVEVAGDDNRAPEARLTALRDLS